MGRKTFIQSHRTSASDLRLYKPPSPEALPGLPRAVASDHGRSSTEPCCSYCTTIEAWCGLSARAMEGQANRTENKHKQETYAEMDIQLNANYGIKK